MYITKEVADLVVVCMQAGETNEILKLLKQSETDGKIKFTTMEHPASGLELKAGNYPFFLDLNGDLQ